MLHEIWKSSGTHCILRLQAGGAFPPFSQPSDRCFELLAEARAARLERRRLFRAYPIMRHAMRPPPIPPPLAPAAAPAAALTAAPPAPPSPLTKREAKRQRLAAAALAAVAPAPAPAPNPRNPSPNVCREREGIRRMSICVSRCVTTQRLCHHTAASSLQPPLLPARGRLSFLLSPTRLSMAFLGSVSSASALLCFCFICLLLSVWGPPGRGILRCESAEPARHPNGVPTPSPPLAISTLVPAASLASEQTLQHEKWSAPRGARRFWSAVSYSFP